MQKVREGNSPSKNNYTYLIIPYKYLLPVLRVEREEGGDVEHYLVVAKLGVDRLGASLRDDKSIKLPCDRKRVQPGTLVHVPGEVGHVMKIILC